MKKERKKHEQDYLFYKGNCKHFFQIYKFFERKLRISLALYRNFNEDVH
jgi:hypothetical protein